MNDQELVAIFNKGKQEEGHFSLNKQHHLGSLTDSDAGPFYRLLQEQCPSLQKIALEDLSLSDPAAAIFGQLIKLNHLTHFSLQGSALGDQCLQSICRALSYQAESANWLLPINTTMPGANFTSLESLIIGAPIATDYGLLLLEQLLVANHSLKKISVNWSASFSVDQAWKLAAATAIHNLSLVKSDYHGFFHNVSLRDAKAIEFINNFLEAVIKRNLHLATLEDPIQKYMYYSIFFSAYDATIRKNFDVTKTEHGLTSLSLKDLRLKPLDEAVFLSNVSKCASPQMNSHRRLASSTTSTPSTPSSPVMTPGISPAIPNGSASRYSRSFSDLVIDLSSSHAFTSNPSNSDEKEESDKYVSYSTSPS